MLSTLWTTGPSWVTLDRLNCIIRAVFTQLPINQSNLAVQSQSQAQANYHFQPTMHEPVTFTEWSSCFHEAVSPRSKSKTQLISNFRNKIVWQTKTHTRVGSTHQLGFLVKAITIPQGRGGTLGISGWGCAARTLEPLSYTRASFSWILLPYTRVNSWFP